MDKTPLTPADPVFEQYYRDNEQYMEDQWNWFIWRKIQDFDLSVTMDFACGYGRNTTKLIDHAEKLYLVDVNEAAITFCRQRFAEAGKDITYVHNDGSSLAGIPDASLTCVYSWDAMVHFSQEILDGYFQEFARVMRPDAKGFIHHSNYGAWGEPCHWQDAPNWRSFVSAESVAASMANAGLEVIDQELQSWDWVEKLDCKTRFRKP